MKRVCYPILVVALLLATAGPAPAQFWGRNRQERKAAHLRAGKAALQDGMFDMAQRELESYIGLAATSRERAEGVLLLSRALFWKGQFQEVADLLRRREGWARGTEFEPDFLLLRARAFFELQNYAEAVMLAGSFGKRFPTHPLAAEATRLHAKCCIRTEQFEPAIRMLASFEKDYPYSIEVPEAMLDWAAALLAMERTEEAIPVLNRLVTSFPGTDAATQARLWLGKLYTERRQSDLARETLSVLAVQENTRIERRAAAWYFLASVESSQTNLAAAIQALDEVERLTGDSGLRARSAALRGQVLARMGRVDEGILSVRQSLRSLPASTAAEAQLELADILLDLGEYDRAAQEFQNFLDAFAEQDGAARAIQGRAWSLWGLGRYAEAANAFDKSSALFTNVERQAESVFKAGDAYFAGRQFKPAVERYQRVARKFPQSAFAGQASLQAAESLVRLDDRIAAEAELFSVVSDHSGTALAIEAKLRLAQLKEAAGLWEQALEFYDQAATNCIVPALCARSLHGGGLIRYRLGLFKDALASFARVVTEYPGSEFAEQSFYMRGWCLYLLGNAEEALAVCRQFLEKYPESRWGADVLFWLGEYYFNRAEFSAAERQFADLAARYPQSQLAADALFWAGRAAAAQKEYLRAIEHFSALSKNYPQSPKLPEARFAQGDALSELGKFPTAILAFDEIIAKHPGSPLVDVAWGRKGDCQFTLGKDDGKRYQEALASYRMVLDSPRADREMKWQAEYKMGRCREKMAQPEEAMERYMSVVYSWLSEAEKGMPGDPLWFTRAAFSAAEIRETQERWSDAASIYKRLADAGVSASGEAEARIQRIRRERGITPGD
jgi:TolA-binding protein